MHIGKKNTKKNKGNICHIFAAKTKTEEHWI